MMTTLLPSREELGLMSCDDISRYSLSSQSGSKGSETVSYYLDQDSGQFFSLLEGDGPPGPEYDRVRNTGVRRRDKTPTHGKTGGSSRWCEWDSNSCVWFVKQHVLFPSNASLFMCSSFTSWRCLFMFLPGVLHTKTNPKQAPITCLMVTLLLPACPLPVTPLSETASETSCTFSQGSWCTSPGLCNGIKPNTAGYSYCKSTGF